jgi:hypothetical protein
VRVIAVVFEGGHYSHSVTWDLGRLRHAVVLDTIDKLRQTDGFDEIIVSTNYPELREQLMSLPVTLAPEQQPFHFGMALQAIVREAGADGVLCMGGASAPFMSVKEFKHMARGLRSGESVVYTNNPQSSDIVAFAPAQAIFSIDPPERDNGLATALRDQAGLARVLLSHSLGVHFDLDTPTDALIMSLSPHTGALSRRVLTELGWSSQGVERAIDRMSQTHCELGLIGRVNPAVMTHINSHTFCRLRVYSEERGMKALHREEKGQVVSLLGHFIRHAGVPGFFSYLAATCDVAFFDTRVLFAHNKLALTEEERFLSDLGRWQEIEHPWLREFTRAAGEASIPVVLGGHSLVTGGMWAIIDILRSRSIS